MVKNDLEIIFNKFVYFIMIKTPIIQPVHSLELGYAELEILAKKALFRFRNIDID